MAQNLFKSSAKVLFKNEAKWETLWRKFKWYDWEGQKLGLLWHDQNCEEIYPEVQEAILRLPPHEYDARQRRITRASLLTLHNELLPKSQWTKWDDETWYLQPYLDEIEREKAERLQTTGKKPWWWYQHHYNQKIGH